MATDSTTALVKPGPLDPVLLVLAFIGFWLFATQLSDHHIDGTAGYEITKEDATDRANTFLDSQGYTVDGLDIRASLNRNVPLLQAMQEDLGRARTIEILGDDANSMLPAFMWSVKYRMPDPGMKGPISLVPLATVFEVSLSSNGAVLAFQNSIEDAGAASISFGSATRAINRTILTKLFAVHDTLESETSSRLSVITDSLLFASLRFARLEESDGFDGPNVLRALERGDPVELDSLSILKLSALHAREQALHGIEWTIDSLYVVPGSPPRLARVRLLTRVPVHGQQLRVDMTITATGNLQEMNVLSNPKKLSEDVISTTLSVIMAGAYLLIGLILFITFIRRIMARLIDVKGSMLDALALGVLVGLYLILSRNITQSAEMGLWGRIGLSLLIFSVFGGATALFGFMISSATESLTREIWPQKLLSGILVRRGDMHNRLVGWSIVRGTAVAGVLVGVGVLALVLFPTLSLDIGESLIYEKSVRPFVSELAFSLTSAYLTLLLVYLGIGTFAFRLGQKTWFAVLSITIAGGFLQIAPFGFAVSWIAVTVSAAVALILALAYIRYDCLTAFIALFVAGLLWGVSEGFMIEDSPAWLDAYVATLIVILLAVLGFVSAFSKRTGAEASQFVPEYITEMAGQERIKRELEIAYQVQASFLPRTMPEVNGLDLAGMCLPASEVGGDYFDFIRLPEDRLAFVVGDVSGKGIQAAFYMTLVKGVIQTLSTSIFSPSVVMQRLNEVFRRNAPRGTFISIIYGIVDPRTRKFTFARAGHNPAILKRAASSEPEFLRPTGMAIGITDGEVFDNTITEVTLQLEPGDVLVFYTDGFSEARSSKRELYGDDRLLNRAGQVGDRSASAILRSLTEDVHHFIEGAGRADDMTMVVVKIPPGVKKQELS